MKEKTIEITDEAGLHARPASKIAKKASEFSGDVKLIYDDKEIDLKSILAVMSLAVPQGGEVTIKVDGGDEDATLEAILEAFGEQGIDIKGK